MNIAAKNSLVSFSESIPSIARERHLYYFRSKIEWWLTLHNSFLDYVHTNSPKIATAFISISNSLVASHYHEVILSSSMRLSCEMCLFNQHFLRIQHHIVFATQHTRQSCNRPPNFGNQQKCKFLLGPINAVIPISCKEKQLLINI